MHIELTAAFTAAYPDGIFGALAVRGCANRRSALTIGADARAVETALRERFAAGGIEADPVAQAYAEYFRRYGGRYPVVHQAKTVLVGRPIESSSALVQAMFTAELESLILTSGHDLGALRGGLTVDVAAPGDAYTRLSGKDQMLRPGDMVVRGAEGIIASVVHGPDARTQIRSGSDTALFGAWCPVKIPAAAVEAHLRRLAGLVRREWPEAAVEAPEVRCSR